MGNCLRSISSTSEKKRFVIVTALFSYSQENGCCTLTDRSEVFSGTGIMHVKFIKTFRMFSERLSVWDKTPLHLTLNIEVFYLKRRSVLSETPKHFA